MLLEDGLFQRWQKSLKASAAVRWSLNVFYDWLDCPIARIIESQECQLGYT